jgi:hypothetical protein
MVAPDEAVLAFDTALDTGLVVSPDLLQPTAASSNNANDAYLKDMLDPPMNCMPAGAGMRLNLSET